MRISPPYVFSIDTMTIDPVSNSAIELLGIPTYTSSSKLKQVTQSSKTWYLKYMVELLLMVN